MGRALLIGCGCAALLFLCLALYDLDLLLVQSRSTAAAAESDADQLRSTITQFGTAFKQLAGRDGLIARLCVVVDHVDHVARRWDKSSEQDHEKYVAMVEQANKTLAASTTAISKLGDTAAHLDKPAVALLKESTDTLAETRGTVKDIHAAMTSEDAKKTARDFAGVMDEAHGVAKETHETMAVAHKTMDHVEYGTNYFVKKWTAPVNWFKRAGDWAAGKAVQFGGAWAGAH